MSTERFILAVVRIVLCALCLAGLVFITPLAWGTKTYSSLSTTQQGVAKFAVTFQWVTIIFGLVYGLWRAFGDN